MAATFDPALPTLKDHIRLTIGDRGPDTWLLTNETIQAKLDTLPYPEALAQLAEGLAAEFAQNPSSYSESGSMSISWGERVKTWLAIADRARSGKIKTPALSTSRIPRGPMAARRLAQQSQTTTTPRTVSTEPTVMEGFRSD